MIPDIEKYLFSILDLSSSVTAFTPSWLSVGIGSCCLFTSLTIFQNCLLFADVSELK